jgi:ssRNA-specific RNase YbeY (16S rRNA maturation enzyme)
VTDVLSFPHDGVGLEGTGITFIGEVLICPSVVRDATLNRVLIHGILHLLEYDHELSEKEEIRMREREDLYL